MDAGRIVKGHQAIARQLQAMGCDALFGLIGDGNLFFADSFARDCGGRYLGAAQEAGAVLMALGHAQASRRLGYATVTHGPGLSNAVTALIEGVKATVPMVLLCGETPVVHKEHLQKIAQRELVHATGAGFEQARSAQTLPQDLAGAAQRAWLERRPVVFNVPIEFQWQDVDFRPAAMRLPELRVEVRPGPALDDAAGILASAKRPVVLAGRGAVSAAARTALMQLAQRIDAPLATTLKAKDLFRGEVFDLGICGTLGSPVALEVVGASDCIVAFGASLTEFTTAQGALFRGKRIVQVNADPAAVGRSVAPDAHLVGDPASTAELLRHLMDEAEVAPSRFADADMAARIAAYHPMAEWVERPGMPDTIDLPKALSRIDAWMPPERIVVTDGGRFTRPAWKVMSAPDAQSFIQTTNYGCIGLGLPVAIGAGIARPGIPVLLVIGDGGFMLGGLAEFHSAVRAGIDLTVVVCNDGGYGAEHVQFRTRNLPPEMSLFPWPDFAGVARSLGGRGATVRNEAELDALRAPLQQRRPGVPLLIDLRLDPDRVPGD